MSSNQTQLTWRRASRLTDAVKYLKITVSDIWRCLPTLLIGACGGWLMLQIDAPLP